MFKSEHPSKKQWMSLSEDEVVLEWCHPSLIPELPNIVIPTLLAIVASLVLFFTNQVNLGFEVFLLIPLGFAFSLYDYMRVINTFYILTDDKLMIKENIVRTDTRIVWYENIQDVDSFKGIWERILRIGDIRVATAGTDQQEFFLDNVRDPEDFVDVINNQKKEAGDTTVEISKDQIEELKD
jgi:uncharacterized membrane protein YdbT with pleckstrin-like domain